MRVLENLQPYKVFYYFEEICNIPHGSKNLDGISSYLEKFARDRGLFCIRDTSNNIIMVKEATPGYEKEEAIMLQGHMDMVAVKKADCDIDMEKDPLRLKIDGDYIYAEGTSLGGDDGVAVAYILAIMDVSIIPSKISFCIVMIKNVFLQLYDLFGQLFIFGGFFSDLIR